MILTQNKTCDAGALPDGWLRTTVGEIYDVVGGGTPSTKVEEYWQGDIPWISSADIYGPKDIRPRRGITEKALRNSATNLVPAGSLIVVTRVGLGKVALTPTPICFSQDSQGLIGSEDVVLPDYAIYYLSQAVQEFRHESRGTTIAGVTKKQLVDLTFVLPPLPEQHRIVAEIETQFTRLEAGVAALKRAQANLRRYRAAVLKAACKGHLLLDDEVGAIRESPGYEPADALLQRILAERRARWLADNPGKKYQAPTPPDTSDLPALPEGWMWASVEQLVDEPLKNGRSVPTCADGFPVLRLTAIKDGRIDPNERKVGDWTEIEAKPYLIEEGDFFVARGSGSVKLVGRGGFVKGKPEPVAFPDTMIRVRVDELLCQGEYLQAIWDAPLVRGQIETTAHTTAGIYKINQKHIGEFVIPLPPLVEQRRIVAEVERRLSVVGETERAVEAALKRADRLRQAILKRAFEGRLVPQDPADEPAPALLARIQATREQGGNQIQKPVPAQLYLPAM